MEIETATDMANDSAEGLKALRTVWSATVEEGQKEQEANATVPGVTFLRATSVPRKLNLDRNLAVPLHMAWA